MIRGTATLDLNEATMIEAVQEYLDKRLTMPAQVKSVKLEQNSSPGLYDRKDVFRVMLQEITTTPVAS